MRLAVAFWTGVVPGDAAGTVRRLKEIGVDGIGHIAVLDGWDEVMLRTFSAGMEEQGCFVGEVTMYQFGWMLAQSDEMIRQEALAKLTKGLCDAQALKAHCVGISTIAGEPGAGDPWAPEVWRRLVDGVGMAAAAGERVGMTLGLHPGNRGPLDSPEQLRKLLDEVASPRLKVILDPVNMTNHRTVFSNTDFLNHMFDLLGGEIIAAHAKDVRFDTSHLITRIDEVPLGSGVMDYETYLWRLAELDDDLVLCVEHYRDVGVSGTVASPVYVDYGTDVENTRARNFLHDTAERLGIEVT